MNEEAKEKYIVYDVVRETPTVSTLKLIHSPQEMVPYIPGQFITVYFPETGTPQGKAYSISSAPQENIISISVKAMGEFSYRLVGLHPGDVVTASLPYGFFYSESSTSHLVFVAAGIGVAPFRSIVIDALEKNPTRHISLLYSTKHAQDILFTTEFEALQKQHPSFSIKYFITQEHTPVPNIPKNPIMNRRIEIQDIVDTARDIAQTEFMICGSIPFIRDIWRGLRNEHVSEESIYTEAFFSH